MQSKETTNIIEKQADNTEKVMHLVKYMGSKRNIIDSVVQAIEKVHSKDKVLVDLFAGSSVLSGAFRNKTDIISNDIQQYSSILAHTYLGDYHWEDYPDDLMDEILFEAEQYVHEFKTRYPLSFDYPDNMTIEEFTKIEDAQRVLIKQNFDFSHHLFVKNYSGTYWTFEQCLWIDAIRKVANNYEGTPIFYVILASLMFAMSYNSQSTGHFAQYRDATSEKSMQDIMIYRQKEIIPFFKRKFTQIRETFGRNQFNFKVMATDFKDCLNEIPEEATVYADPPYCFVHYSRFYHAFETLVRYDYPEVKHKGRYRTDRHQSPFCIRSQVVQAFTDMFQRIKNKNSNLVLSYSNTGMIELEALIILAKSHFGDEYKIFVETQDYLHSTMGRKEDKSRNVQECLIIAQKK